MFDSITSLLGDFDLTKFVPDIETFVGKMELAARIAVMVGPLLLLGLGLWYLLAPPKDNRQYIGFRTFRRARTVQAWRFTQHIAGLVWGALGVALTVIMALICNAFRWMDGLTMAATAIICVAVELVLLTASIIFINIHIGKYFDKEGYPIRKQ